MWHVKDMTTKEGFALWVTGKLIFPMILAQKKEIRDEIHYQWWTR